MMEVVNLDRELDHVSELWSPRVLARVNDHYLKVAKLKGDLVWHSHEDEDELFLVLKGRLKIEIAGSEPKILRRGDLFVIPRGTKHNPVAEQECWILLVEPVTTAHTGDVDHPRTRSIEEQMPD